MKELTIRDLFRILWNKINFIACVTGAAIILAAVLSFFILPKEYTAKTTLYVLNQQNENTISSSDLSSGLQLVNDYRELIQSRTVQEAAAYDLGYMNLNGYTIEVTALSNTRFLEIAVTGGKAYLAANIANSLATNFAERVTEIMRVDNVSIIDVARVPTKASGPQRERNIVIAALVGFVLSFGIVLLKETLDVSIRTADDVEEMLDLPVLAQIPRIDLDKSGR